MWVRDPKLLSFVVVGVLTLAYSLLELAVAVSLNSLSLLSDGFHNLSDVISLYIAFWATIAAKRDISDSMTFGWARSEILGGLTNGMFLVSLALYIVLESIPRFIHPESVVEDNLLEPFGSNVSAWIFIGVAAAGLLVNTLGTGIFALTGTHGHSHAGGGHGHSHGGGGADHGHSHGGGQKSKKKCSDGHAHAHGGSGSIQCADEDDSHGFQSHALDDVLLEGGHGHGHGHGHDHGHGHGHGDSHHDEEEPGFHKQKKTKWDLNVRAVFLHYLGDMLSSAIVLVVGILLRFLPHYWWVDYIDPLASLAIVVLILWTTLPLVKHCAMILMQSTGRHELQQIREQLQAVRGVVNVHDLHVWMLVDDVSIASVHIGVADGAHYADVTDRVRKVFHQHGIHSSTIQPELHGAEIEMKDFCLSNCVEHCDEDWCCKKRKDMENK